MLGDNWGFLSITTRKGTSLRENTNDVRSFWVERFENVLFDETVSLVLPLGRGTHLGASE